MHPSVHWSTVYNNQDMEATKMSINRRMDKENVSRRICEIKQESLEKGKEEEKGSEEFTAVEVAALKGY